MLGGRRGSRRQLSSLIRQSNGIILFVETTRPAPLIKELFFEGEGNTALLRIYD